MNRPFISIIIPTYNRPSFLDKAIRSCISQTDGDLEIIIVNDGDKNEVLSLIKNLNDDRIIFLNNPGKGRSAARNEGALKAKGKFIAYLDDDDLYYNDFVKNTKGFINNHKIKSGIIFHDIHIKEKDKETTFSFEKSDIIKRVWINGSSPIMYCVSRDIGLKYHFPVGIDYAEDFHFVISVILQNKAYLNHQINGQYNKHGNSTLNNINKSSLIKYSDDFEFVIKDLFSNFPLIKKLGLMGFLNKYLRTRKRFINIAFQQVGLTFGIKQILKSTISFIKIWF